MSNDLATRSADLVPNYSMGDMQIMAKAVAESGLGGIRNQGAALTLLLLSQAEGLHPIQALRQFHIIEGRPSLRADAMQARFEAAGGRIKWMKRDDQECRARFFRDANDADGTEIAWTMQDAVRAQLSNKDVWKKYPRNMLHARCISEGIRAVRPEVVVGFYTPEEVQDFDPPAPRPNRNQQTEPAAKKGDVVEGEIIEPPDSAPVSNQPNDQIDPAFYKAGRDEVVVRGFPPEVFDRFMADRLAKDGKKFGELHERHRVGIIGKLKRTLDAGQPIDAKNSNYDGELFAVQIALTAESRGGSGEKLVAFAKYWLDDKKKMTVEVADRSLREEVMKHITAGEWDAYLREPGNAVADEPLDNTVAFNLFSDAGRDEQISDDVIDQAWAAWTASIGIGDQDPIPAATHATLMQDVKNKKFGWATAAAAA